MRSSRQDFTRRNPRFDESPFDFSCNRGDLAMPLDGVLVFGDEFLQDVKELGLLNRVKARLDIDFDKVQLRTKNTLQNVMWSVVPRTYSQFPIRTLL